MVDYVQKGLRVQAWGAEHTVKPKQLWHNSLGKTVKSLLRQKRPGRSVDGTHHTVRQRMENWQLERFSMNWQPVSQIKADNLSEQIVNMLMQQYDAMICYDLSVFVPSLQPGLCLLYTVYCIVL